MLALQRDEYFVCGQPAGWPLRNPLSELSSASLLAKNSLCAPSFSVLDPLGDLEEDLLSPPRLLSAPNNLDPYFPLCPQGTDALADFLDLQCKECSFFQVN